MKELVMITIVVLLIGVGVYYATVPTEDGTNTNVTTTNENEASEVPNADKIDGNGSSDGSQTSASTGTESTVVRYTGSGFQPSQVTVSQGDTIRFVNESGNDMWVGVDEHPTHTNYDGSSLNEHCPDPDNTRFDQCETGDQYSFTFDKTGEFEYHNHVRPNDVGTVVVQ